MRPPNPIIRLSKESYWQIDHKRSPKSLTKGQINQQNSQCSIGLKSKIIIEGRKTKRNVRWFIYQLESFSLVVNKFKKLFDEKIKFTKDI